MDSRLKRLCALIMIIMAYGAKALQEVSRCRRTTTPANQTSCEAGDDVTVFEQYGYSAAHVPMGIWDFMPPCLDEGEVTPVLDEDGDPSFLSDGRYADIVLGKMASSGQFVAIKKFRHSSPTNVLGEGAIQSYLWDTGYVPRLLGMLHCASPGNLSLVMDLLPDCPSFGDVIFRHRLSLCQLLNISFQLADAVMAIHRKFVLHHDLHRENVLVDFRGDNPVLYVIDFGHATFRKSRSYSEPSTLLRHYKFLSPEAKQHSVATPASDVYSLGLMLRDVNERVHDVRLARLVRACTAENPSQRPKLWVVVAELKNLLANCSITALQIVPEN